MMSGQLMFVVRRLLLTIPMLFVMSVVVFLIIRLVPGDPVRTMLGFRATDANVAKLRHQLGLDQSADRTSTSTGPARCCAAISGKDIVTHAPLSELLAAALAGDLRTHRALHAARGAVGVPLGIRAATGGRWTRSASPRASSSSASACPTSGSASCWC